MKLGLLKVLGTVAYQIYLFIIWALLYCLYIRRWIKMRVRIRQLFLDVVSTDLCMILLNYMLRILLLLVGLEYRLLIGTNHYSIKLQVGRKLLLCIGILIALSRINLILIIELWQFDIVQWYWNLRRSIISICTRQFSYLLILLHLPLKYRAQRIHSIDRGNFQHSFLMC